MAIVTDEVRMRKTNAVGKRDESGKILVPNGHKGRSQRGCFGSPNYSKKENR